MTNPNQNKQQSNVQRDRGTGQTPDEQRQRQQQGGRQQPDMPASAPRTDRDLQDNPNPNRTDMGDRTDVEGGQQRRDDPMRKGGQQSQDR